MDELDDVSGGANDCQRGKRKYGEGAIVLPEI